MATETKLDSLATLKGGVSLSPELMNFCIVHPEISLAPIGDGIRAACPKCLNSTKRTDLKI